MYAVATNGVVGKTGDASAQTDAAARHAKLTHAAQQFEAVMMGELMRPLSSSTAIGGDESDSSQSGPLQSFGVEAMASALAKSGALGFAGRIVAAVESHDPKMSLQKVSAAG